MFFGNNKQPPVGGGGIAIDESLNERDHEFNQAIHSFKMHENYRTPIPQQSNKICNIANIASSVKESPRQSNPLMGESEGEYRKRLILSEYKDYMRQQQDAYTLEPKASFADF